MSEYERFAVIFLLAVISFQGEHQWQDSAGAFVLALFVQWLGRRESASPGRARNATEKE